MIDAREIESLRRLGYRVAGRTTLIGQIVEDERLRVRPMSRATPRFGHHVGNCPRCGEVDALWIAPDWRSFSTTCGCVRGEAGALALLMLLVRSAA